MTMLTAESTSDANAIMGIKAAFAADVVVPDGMVGWKVIQSWAAPMVLNIDGTMPLLKVTPFIIEGQPAAPLGLGVKEKVLGTVGNVRLEAATLVVDEVETEAAATLIVDEDEVEGGAASTLAVDEVEVAAALAVSNEGVAP